MKIVLVNVDFIDAYTGKLRPAGSRAEMTDERIAEIRAINPEFVSIIGVAEEKAEEKAEKKGK